MWRDPRFRNFTRIEKVMQSTVTPGVQLLLLSRMSLAEAVPLLAHSPIRQLQRAKMTESLRAIVWLTLALVVEIETELRLVHKNRQVSWRSLPSLALPFVRILALTRRSARGASIAFAAGGEATVKVRFLLPK